MAVNALLKQQIAAAQAERKPVDVVVYFRAPVGVPTVSSDLAKEIADRVLRRTAKSVGEAPNRVTVFEHLNALAVGASPDFILQLAKQPEVLTIKASHLPESFAFEPRKTPAARSKKSGRKVR